MIILFNHKCITIIRAISQFIESSQENCTGSCLVRRYIGWILKSRPQAYRVNFWASFAGVSGQLLSLVRRSIATVMLRRHATIESLQASGPLITVKHFWITLQSWKKNSKNKTRYNSIGFQSLQGANNSLIFVTSLYMSYTTIW